MAHYDAENNLVLDPEDFENEANPYVKRFNDYRSDADRRATEYQQTQQQLADLQSDDAATQRAAAEALGLVFIEEEEQAPDPSAPDPKLSALEQRIAKFEEAEAKREAESARVEAEREFSAKMDTRVAELGLNPKDKHTAVIIAHAANNFAFLEDGLPDLAAARAELEALDDQRFETWKKGKRTPTIQVGPEGRQQVAIEDMSAEDRITWAMEQHDVG